MPARTRAKVASLFHSVAGKDAPELAGLNESTWIDVVRKMDEVYADLIRYEVDLEGKHNVLGEAHDFISGVPTAGPAFPKPTSTRSLIRSSPPSRSERVRGSACRSPMRFSAITRGRSLRPIENPAAWYSWWRCQGRTAS